MRALIVPAIAATLLVSTAALAEPCSEHEENKEPCKEYEHYMSPGGTFQFYAPSRKGAPYMGGGFQISIAQWAHDNDDYGPSRGNVFFQASLLGSPASEHVLGIYEGGMTLALERNANRKFLIPYFGFTTGGMYQTGFLSSAFVQPVAGLHVLWTPTVVIEASGGYMFPFVNADDNRGFRAQATVRVNLW
jgi:hypothetical protein